MLVHSSRLKGFLREFVEKREQLKPQEHFVSGYHPKNGLVKKETSFYPGCCNVRFDRTKLPRSGKSNYNTVWIDTSGGLYKAYDTDTRALLLVSTKELNTDDLDTIIEQFKRIKDENKRRDL